MKTVVHHWRYHDGMEKLPLELQTPNGPTTNTVFFSEELKGWHCWVYPSTDSDIDAWLKENMIGKYDCTFRFNSGDPMYTIHIKEDQDATLFKLTWM